MGHRLPEISEAETRYATDHVPFRHNEAKQLVVFLAMLIALVLPSPWLGATLVLWAIFLMWMMP